MKLSSSCPRRSRIWFSPSQSETIEHGPPNGCQWLLQHVEMTPIQADKGDAVATRECQTLKTLLSLLYKSAALAGIVTIVVTLDVALSLAVIVGAFSLYYVSRAIVARLCPTHDRDEHQDVVRSLRPSRQQIEAASNTISPTYTNNVTPLRRNTTSKPRASGRQLPAELKVKRR